MSDSLQTHGLYSSWNSPGQNTGVGSLSLLQGDLPNPGIKPRYPSLEADSSLAEPQGSPRVLEWVACLFSSRSSPPRNQTRVSCIAGRFFTRQYFGHLLQRVDSLEKTLMLGKIEGKRRGWQMRWLNSITDSMDMNLSKFRKIINDRGAWCVAVHGVARSQTRLSDSTTSTYSTSFRI